jgi:hypothetical protein
MRVNPALVLILAVCAVVAALTLWLWPGDHVESPDPASSSPREAVAPRVQPEKENIAVSPIKPPKEPASNGVPTIGLAQGMVDANPLAFVTQQHALAKPGSFASAEQVTYQCREGNQLVGKASPQKAVQRAALLGKDAATLQARFIEAQQIVQTRCNDFRQDVATDTPLKNDNFAAEYLDARIGTSRPDENFANNLIALAKQGQLASAYRGLTTIWKFQGEDFKADEDRAIFQEAVQLAAFNSTSVEGSRDKDLRTLTGCLATGICDGTYDSLALYRWPEGSPQREKALALAKRMEAVFRANDIQAWIRKP